MSELEFGHTAFIGKNFRADAWGSGPFLLTVSGKTHCFEDSDRFGPCRLKANGEPSDANPYWPERHPFWAAHRAWVKQGRRLEADGKTCVWDAPEPSVYRKVGRHRLIIKHGDDDGGFVEEITAPNVPAGTGGGE